MTEARTPADGSDRLAKVISRSGLCSRRDAETWITAGRVSVNGKLVKTPAFNVTDKDKIKVDGVPLADRQGTRVWLYHKPAGLVVTEKDPEGRPTVFEAVEALGLPRVVSIGRLDINTEGLLLLTNDGGLKRVLELPATGWLRKYRVRAFGTVTQAQLDGLKNGITVDGVTYGSIEATLESERGSNVWIEVALREGKNREVKNVLGALGLTVNRLIRVSYGPFMLGDIAIGAIETVRAKVLKDQLGKRLAEEADVDFESEFHDRGAALAGKPAKGDKKDKKSARADKNAERGNNTVTIGQERFRFTDRSDEEEADRPRIDRGPHHRPGGAPVRGRGRVIREVPTGPSRTIFFEDGREEEIPGKPLERGERSFDDKPRGERSFDKGERGERSFGDKPRGKGGFGDKPRGDRPFGDKPRGDRPFGDKPRGNRSFGDKPAGERGAFRKGPRPEGGDDRPRRSFGDKPRFERGGEGGDRPKRPYGDKPRGDRPFGEKRSFGDKPRFDRAEGGEGRPARSERPRGDFAPRGPRPDGDRPFGKRPDGPRGPARGPRPEGGRPRSEGGDRPARSGGGGKPFAGKRDGAPGGGRPPRAGGGGKPGGRPGGGRPGGGGPRRPRGE